MNEHNQSHHGKSIAKGNMLIRALIAFFGVIAVALTAYLVWALANAGTNAQSSTLMLTPVVTGAPRLQVDQDQVDMGDIKLGQTVQTLFTLTNAGDQPLQITEPPYIEVLEGCCPPVPSVGKQTLQPGESTTLSMQYMMHAGMGGKHHFSVHVKTNDPSQRDRTLDVFSNWVG
jgi:hypothetical protein